MSLDLSQLKRRRLELAAGQRDMDRSLLVQVVESFTWGPGPLNDDEDVFLARMDAWRRSWVDVARPEWWDLIFDLWLHPPVASLEPREDWERELSIFMYGLVERDPAAALRKLALWLAHPAALAPAVGAIGTAELKDGLALQRPLLSWNDLTERDVEEIAVAAATIGGPDARELVRELKAALVMEPPRYPRVQNPSELLRTLEQRCLLLALGRFRVATGAVETGTLKALLAKRTLSPADLCELASSIADMEGEHAQECLEGMKAALSPPAAVSQLAPERIGLLRHFDACLARMGRHEE